MIGKFFFSLVIVALGHPSFVPWLAPLAASFGYACFWHSISANSSKKRTVAYALVWYFFVQLVQLSWMSATDYQGGYILFVYFGLSLLLSLQFAIFSLFIPKVNSSYGVARIFALCTLWVLIEWSRYFFVCGYTFNQMGIALAGYTLSAQFAALFGVMGLTFWVALSNLVGLRFWQIKKIRAAICYASILFVPYFFGFVNLIWHTKQQKAAEPLSVVIVQPGLSPAQKIPLDGYLDEFMQPSKQWQHILSLLKKIDASDADFIVLPESVLPYPSIYPMYETNKMEQIFIDIFGDSARVALDKVSSSEGKNALVSNVFLAKVLSSLLRSPVIIGLDHSDSVQRQSYNSAFCFFPDRTDFGRYDKRILMPLAEYLPLRFLAPLVAKYGVKTFYTPGKETKLFHAKVPFSLAICYEETFPHLIREGRQMGAELFVHLTNDGWYPFSRLAKVHLDHARLRCIENGVPMIRSCNTGISAVIDSLGQIVQSIDESDEKGRAISTAVRVELPAYHYKTLYLFFGDRFLISASALYLLFFMLYKFFYLWRSWKVA